MSTFVYLFTVHLFMNTIISILGDKMILINSKFQHDLSFDVYSLYEDTCFLDIETLGLNRNRDMVYLVGLMYFNQDEDSWNLDQYFAEDLQDEKSMLLELVQAIPQFSTIITYNGDAFDIPFLNNRFKIYNIEYQISKDISLDLYSIVRKNKQYLNLENYKLKTLERSIGIYREDVYSGRDCIQFYKNYLLTNDLVLKDNILRHNYEDLFYMLDLFKVLDIIKEKKTLYLTIGEEYLNIIIENLKVDSDYLIITGIVESKSRNIINYYGNNYKFIIEDNNEFTITLEIKKGLINPKENCLFIYNREFALDIYDASGYITPEGVILIQVEKDFIIINIKNIVEALIKRILIAD